MTKSVRDVHQLTEDNIDGYILVNINTGRVRRYGIMQ